MKYYRTFIAGKLANKKDGAVQTEEWPEINKLVDDGHEIIQLIPITRPALFGNGMLLGYAPTFGEDRNTDELNKLVAKCKENHGEIQVVPITAAWLIVSRKG